MSNLGLSDSLERESILTVVDVRYSGTLDRLCRERDGCKGRAHIEWLDNCHVVLVVLPGGLRRVQR